MKRCGVLTAEPLGYLRRVCHKLGWFPRRSDVWHLLDTVDAQRVVIGRYADRWTPTREQTGIGFWVDPSGQGRRPKEMSRAEQLVIYGKVVRPQAPAWPEDD